MGFTGYTGPAGSGQSFSFTGATGSILYHDGNGGITGSNMATFSSTQLSLSSANVIIDGATLSFGDIYNKLNIDSNGILMGNSTLGQFSVLTSGISMGDLSTNFSIYNLQPRVVGANGLIVETVLQATSIRDSNSSVGGPDQVLTSGNGGGTLTWIDVPTGPASLGTTGATGPMGFTGYTGPAGSGQSFSFTGATGSILYHDGNGGVTGSSGFVIHETDALFNSPDLKLFGTVTAELTNGSGIGFFVGADQPTVEGVNGLIVREVLEAKSIRDVDGSIGGPDQVLSASVGGDILKWISLPTGGTTGPTGPSGSGGGVTSLNGETGAVILSSSDGSIIFDTITDPTKFVLSVNFPMPTWKAADSSITNNPDAGYFTLSAIPTLASSLTVTLSSTNNSGNLALFLSNLDSYNISAQNIPSNYLFTLATTEGQPNYITLKVDTTGGTNILSNNDIEIVGTVIGSVNKHFGLDSVCSAILSIGYSSGGGGGTTGATGATGPAGSGQSFSFTGPTGSILYHDGNGGVTGSSESTINDAEIQLKAPNVNLIGSNSISLKDGNSNGFFVTFQQPSVIGSNGLIVDEVLKAKSIRDVDGSIGGTDQVLSAGDGGDRLKWINQTLPDTITSNDNTVKVDTTTPGYTDLSAISDAPISWLAVGLTGDGAQGSTFFTHETSLQAGLYNKLFLSPTHYRGDFSLFLSTMDAYNSIGLPFVITLSSYSTIATKVYATLLVETDSFTYISTAGAQVFELAVKVLTTSVTAFSPNDVIKFTISPYGSSTAICATAHSNASQSFTAGTSANLEHTVVDFQYGITVTTGTPGNFKVLIPGVYKIIPSLQLEAPNNGHIHVWLKVNGINVPNTTTYLTFKNGEYQVFTTEILLELDADDEVQVWAQSSVNGNILQFIGPGTDYPAAPGIITNMYKLR
jgi:hypothetical protein